MLCKAKWARVGLVVALASLPNALWALQTAQKKLALAPSCYQIGKSSQRISNMLQIVSSHPTAQAYNTLGALFAEHNHTSCAVESFQSALRLDPASWQSRYNLAIALVQKGDLGGAEAQLRKAVHQDPNSAAAHNALGLVLEKAGQQAQAVDEFKAAVRINPRLAEATLNLAQVLSAQKKYLAAIYYLSHALETNPPKESVEKLQVELGVAYGQNKESQKAIDILGKVVTAHPDSIDAHFNLGTVYANEKTPDGYRSAAKEFQQVLRLDPKNSAARLALARALLSVQSYAGAVASLEAYIRQEPRRYEGYYNLGRAYYQQGNDQQAAPVLERAALLAPGNYDVRFEYGLALARIGRVDEAMKEFRAAEKIKPDDPQAHYQLALLLSKAKQQAQSHSELKAFQALKEYKDEQESAGGLNNKANKFFEEGNYQQAAAVYQQVVKMSPNNARWHYNYSLALAKLGDRKQEKQELQTVVRLDPNMADAHNELGLLYMGDHKLAAAEQEFRFAVGINPQDAEAQNNLGVLYSQQGKDNEALSLFQQAAKNDPHYTRAFINLGLTFARHGNYYMAGQQFEKALKLEPKNTGALTAMGMLLAKLGHRREAIEKFQQVVKLQPGSADAHLNLGIAMAEGYNPQGALKEFSEAVRLAPDSAVAHFDRGRVLYDLDKRTEARTELETAHRLAPNYTPPLYFLAAMDAPSPHSVTLLRQLISLQPQNSAAQYLLGQNLMQQGKTEEAIQHWEIAVKTDSNNSSALYNLARILAKTHDPEAKRYMARFQALQQNNQMNDRVHQLNNFALEAAQNHNWPLAVTQLKEAMKACGQCQAIPTLHKNLGLIYARKGDVDDAVRELDLALKEDPQNADAQKALALLDQQKKSAAESN
jgi:tetratricopeptide (TPR) repeat protein